MPKHSEVIGTFVREKHIWESDDGMTRTIVGEIEASDSAITIIRGDAQERALAPGIEYCFYGRWDQHWRFGRQFRFDSFVPLAPAGEQAVKAYLRQLDGVGPSKAQALWKLWGDDSIRMMRENPLLAAKAIGLSPELALEGAEFLIKRLAVEKTTVELFGLLHGRSLPRFAKLVEKLIKDFGAEAAIIIRRNPYLLMRYFGCGFLRTDKLWLEFEHPPERLKRQALCAWHAIAADTRGDTWYPWTTARDAISKNIAGSKLRVDDALELALRAKLLDEYNEGSRRYIAEANKSRAEQRVAEFIATARAESRERGAFWPSINQLAGHISTHQFRELTLALQEFIGVLAGSPGTGKTYTTAALMRLVISQVGENHVAACAPTGKAAVRLSEALAQNDVPLKATTIHSMLGVKISDSDDGGGWAFERHQGNHLPFRFVFIDESSMIDTGLMASLLSARGRHCHMLFIGDPHQLAPVGHGAPLRDFITYGLPCGKLTEIQRNAGMIVRACADIREKRAWKTAPRPNLPEENLVLLERSDPEDQIETLTTLMGQFIAGKKYDPIWDVQVVVAVNAKSPLGRKPLNARLQNLLNPNGEQAQGNPFRIGDKIINTKNASFPLYIDPNLVPVADAAADWSRHPLSNLAPYRRGPQLSTVPTQPKAYVANGEQAEVLHVEPNRTIATLTAPDRTIIIPRGNATQDDEVLDTEEEASGTGCKWELGFAISGHKSQGSEWPIVIILLDDYPGAKWVQSRQWLFTAISRAKILGLLIGQRSVADEACRRDALFARKTFLVERLRSCDGDPGPELNLAGVLAGVL